MGRAIAFDGATIGAFEVSNLILFTDGLGHEFVPHVRLRREQLVLAVLDDRDRVARIAAYRLATIERRALLAAVVDLGDRRLEAAKYFGVVLGRNRHET